MTTPSLPCPACLTREVSRRWTGQTEVDTFDSERGGRAEYHYEESCARCDWRRQGKSRMDPATWAEQSNREERLFRHGWDAMPSGSLIGTMHIHAELKPASVEMPDPTSSRGLAAVLKHCVFQAVSMAFETDAGTYKRSYRPLDVARAASSLGLQLAQSGYARAMFGDSSAFLEVESKPAPVARLLEGSEEQWIGPAGVVTAAIERFWHSYREELVGASASAGGALAACVDALTAGMPVPTGPVEPLGEGLELLRRLAPSIHAELLGTMEGAEGRDVWRGVRTDTTLSWPLQMAAWVRASHDQEDAYHLRLRPGRVTLLSRSGGRLTVLDDVFPVTDLVGIAARLSFAWRYRRAFVDGLSLMSGELDGLERVRVPSGQPLTLLPLAADHAIIVVEPRAMVTVGRASDNDIVLAHKLVSKRQSVLSAAEDGWLVRDNGSLSGTWVDSERVSADTPIHWGDRLDLGGLKTIVA